MKLTRITEFSQNHHVSIHPADIISLSVGVGVREKQIAPNQPHCDQIMTSVQHVHCTALFNRFCNVLRARLSTTMHGFRTRLMA